MPCSPLRLAGIDSSKGSCSVSMQLQDLKCISLFSGIGGLDAGIEASGFSVRACVELDPDARSVLRILHPGWNLLAEGDACKISPDTLADSAGVSRGTLDLLVGGPPCQPFSHASAWRSKPTGVQDPRVDPFRRVFVVAQSLLPSVIILENVPSLAHSVKGRSWVKSWFTRLNSNAAANYVPHFIVVNSADFGVPQHRRRLFVVAHRDGNEIAAPIPTHGNSANGDAGSFNAYRSCWDAIGQWDSPEWPGYLNCTGRWAKLLPTIPEGMNYYFHTNRGGGKPLFGWRTRYWTFLLKLAKSRPSWTLSANPGPASGPFHWRNRLLSEREMAALQTIPWNDEIHIPLRTARRLIGNAVPSALGEMIGWHVRKTFWGHKVPRVMTLVPPTRTDCPPPEVEVEIPEEYRHLIGSYAPHPGRGLGPAPWKNLG